MKTIIPAFASLMLASAAVAAQHEGHGSGSQELHQSMTKGAQEMQAMEMSGNLDRDFVKTMLMHHRHGVEMARIQIEHGRDAKAKEFARKTVEQQTKEIRELERWLQGPSGKPGERK